MISSFLGRALWPVLAGGLALVIVAVAYLYGKSAAREDARRDALIEFTETMERIQDEDTDLTDAGAVRRRLCALAGIDPCPLLGDEG